MLRRHPFLSLLTGGYLVFVAWLTLTPQPINARGQAFIVRALDALHHRGYVVWLDYDRLEFLANIGLFVPIGMFLLLLLGIRRWWLASLTCVAMTVGIETAQLDIPGRYSTLQDVFANSVGGFLGVLLALVLTLPETLRRRRARRRLAVAQQAQAVR